MDEGLVLLFCALVFSFFWIWILTHSDMNLLDDEL